MSSSSAKDATKDPPVLVFYVNQRKIVEPNPDPEETLISYLRQHLQLTGTKLACGEGGCGACTVMISRYLASSSRIENVAANACLVPLCSVHGASITTVEGISRSGALHPIQERLAACHGSQCGFCTPGMVMTAYALLRNHPEPTDRQIEDALQGNLCRCTGYRPILEGLRTFSSGCCGNGKRCCRQQVVGDVAQEDGLSTRVSDTTNFLPYDASQEPIFPSELQLRAKEFDSEALMFYSKFATWHRPISLRELLQLKHDHPDAKIVNGNTEVGVEVKSKKVTYSCLIHPTSVKELFHFEVDESGISIGAATTLTTIMEKFKELIDDDKFAEHQKRGLRAYVEMLHWFSGHQVRNVSAIGGNIMTASPISDLNPLLMSSRATLKFASLNGGTRTVVMDDKFFTGYRRTATQPEEVLISVRLPHCGPNDYQYGFKQARRREDDIAIVNAGMMVRFRSGEGHVVESATLCYGGLAPVTREATDAASSMVGRRWSDVDLVETVIQRLDAEFPLSANAPGGQTQFRKTLCASFFVRFLHRVGRDLNTSSSKVGDDMAVVVDESAADRLPQRLSAASQLFERVPAGQLAHDPVGRPIQHVSGDSQAAGHAQFADDLPVSRGEVFVYPVFSAHACARIVAIDASAAMALDPGVLGVIDRRDVPGCNEFGLHMKDDRVFADGESRFQGEVVAAVVATDRELARRASHLVKVQYEDIRKPIVTISDAIQAGSFYPDMAQRWLRQGDVDAALADQATHVVEGEVSIGGQEHFYFEPQTCLVIPKDSGEMEIFDSTQSPTLAQSVVAEVLGIPQNRVTVRVKRLGGGFGGKESRHVSVATVAAVAAKKFNRPSRCVLDRADDMMTTGTRNPALIRYRAGVDSNGRMVGLKIDAYLNGGYTLDLSADVAGYVVLRTSNAYNIGVADLRCRVCRTNTPSNTAFRGFGAPQAMVGIETVMSELARVSGLTDRAIREINFINTGEVSPYGQVYEDVTVQQCWSECLQLADYDKRKAEVEKFNANQKYRKRGIQMTPVCFGIGFGKSFMHQAGALVNVYLDGSVLITHGGVEMGQGLHTKLLQVASRVLSLPMERLFISETATDKVPNTSSSAASITTDLNAPAVMDACQRIRDRLLPYMHENPKAGWEAWVNAAYMDGVSLSANGFFHNPEHKMNDETMQGRPFTYITFGAACSEVEVDLLTGDHVNRRSDIVMDLGASLNPAIDIGQIEGAFLQGIGLYTLEEQRFSPAGHLLTKGPGAYKIPGFGDIPEVLNVHLLRGSLCKFPRAVYSSKAVGEPPLCLSASVFMAIRDAVAAARRQTGADEEFRFDAPATSERIRIACADDIAVRFAKSALLADGAMPWELKLGH